MTKHRWERYTLRCVIIQSLRIHIANPASFIIISCGLCPVGPPATRLMVVMIWILIYHQPWVSASVFATWVLACVRACECMRVILETKDTQFAVVKLPKCLDLCVRVCECVYSCARARFQAFLLFEG